jgi:RNA polymerase sigma-70 factor (ECF subfamily)
MPDKINESLLARAQAGNASAIGELYELYQGDIYRYLFYRVGADEDAEDLTSEVFLRVIKALPGYRRNNSPFRAWVFRIAHNLIVDYYRKENIRDHIEIDEKTMSDEAGPDLVVEHILDIHDLAHALQALTPDQRDVIIFRFVLEMSIREVAHSVEKSETAVKAAQRRGLQSLRRILDGWKVPNG